MCEALRSTLSCSLDNDHVLALARGPLINCAYTGHWRFITVHQIRTVTQSAVTDRARLLPVCTAQPPFKRGQAGVPYEVEAAQSGPQTLRGGGTVKAREVESTARGVATRMAGGSCASAIIGSKSTDRSALLRSGDRELNCSRASRKT